MVYTGDPRLLEPGEIDAYKWHEDLFDEVERLRDELDAYKSMRSKLDIIEEIQRVKKEMSFCESIGDDKKWGWLSSRYWALKWVMEDETDEL